MDRFNDLQTAFLAQELSAWGGDSNIYDTGNNVTNVQTELFTEQFVYNTELFTTRCAECIKSVILSTRL
ncbi:MAG: hypothetical protein K2J91_01885 [Lachnospiraceae bacterium]|nr:hypothetical protein [Lachnospiraceae bacterium]